VIILRVKGFMVETVGNSQCNFFSLQLELEGNNQLNVQAGDYLGFSWTDSGVVCYAETGSVAPAYCAKEIAPKLGDTVVLQTGPTSNRDYAVRARYSPEGTGKNITYVFFQLFLSN
jgi:hypothetical protein